MTVFMAIVAAGVAQAAVGLAISDDGPVAKPEPVYVETSPLAFERGNRYEVWQYLAVDRQGRFRPRVIYSPYGAYYLYSGAPFPWTATRPAEFMPYASD
jgi:hypothetical protein